MKFSLLFLLCFNIYFLKNNIYILCNRAERIIIFFFRARARVCMCVCVCVCVCGARAYVTQCINLSLLSYIYNTIHIHIIIRHPCFLPLFCLYLNVASFCTADVEDNASINSDIRLPLSIKDL